MRTDAYIAVSIALSPCVLYILLRFRNGEHSRSALSLLAFTAFSIIGFYSSSTVFCRFAMEIDPRHYSGHIDRNRLRINDTVW